MKKTLSAYTKMYLVTPSVYQKLLNCIEEKDKNSIENLNTDKTEGEIKTPSEQIVQKISNQDVGIQTVNETSNFGNQFNPNMGNVETQTIDTPTNQIFGSEYLQDEFHPEEQGGAMEIKETHTNPLKTPCQNNSNTNEDVMPNLVYRPSNPSNKIPTIPAISRKSLKKFMCEVCGKTFTRNHDLKRHLSTPAIHKYIKSANKQSNPTQFLQDEFHPEEPQSENFDTWQPVKPITPPVRSLPPSIIRKRNASKAKLGNIRIPNKMRPDGGNDRPIEQADFDSWVF